jgi:4-amino-4-deoxy-L-arabinose transferase-like glycosyltransferase
MTTGAPDQVYNKPFFYGLLLIAIGLNAGGLFNEILEPDSALYAAIAKRMAQNNDWINLYGDGGDWLDKPHFPFWIAALSFKWLGISAFTYKLPAFLFWLLGLRFTYLLAASLYPKTVALFAVIIYATTLHVVIANFDVRAEPYLTTCILGSMYYMYQADERQNWRFIIPAACFMAGAIMTKGIFVLVTIAGGFVLYWIFTRAWKQFIHYKWWLLLLLTFVFILPELYCLYVQFDLHPEKVIFGKTNVSGIRFFFWDSQFGRFFNTGPIKGSGDYSFFLHTTLWAFLPWSLLLCAALYQLLRRRLPVAKKQMILYGSAAITFLLFSLSKFQLPHYIIIIFPHLAILTSIYIFSIRENPIILRRMLVTQSVLLVMAGSLVAGLLVLFPSKPAYISASMVFAITISLLLFFRKPTIGNVLFKTIFFAILLFSFLHLFFYPRLLQYQSGMLAGKWLRKKTITENIALYKNFSYSLEFYSPVNVDRLDDSVALKAYLAGKPRIVYTAAENINVLQAASYKTAILARFSYFPISRLDMAFINRKTRADHVQEIVLVRISPGNP